MIRSISYLEKLLKYEFSDNWYKVNNIKRIKPSVRASVREELKEMEERINCALSILKPGLRAIVES
jgi:16S rRNA C1402 N4-methylase RsmH